MIFTMAKVSKAFWKAFQEVSSLFEMGGLKEQKVNSGEIMHSTVSLRQSHMKLLLYVAWLMNRGFCCC